MTFFLGYEYDIFVSYAHVDDQPMPGAAQGWVTTFMNCINIKLAQKLDRHEICALWMDHELRGGQPITPHILDKLQRSAMLVVVLSQGYLKSVWCQQELDTFAGMVANSQARSIFVVELDRLDEAELPRPLADLKRSRFWIPDKKTGSSHRLDELVQDADEYYSRIDDLVEEVVIELNRLRFVQTQSAGKIFLTERKDNPGEQRNNQQEGRHAESGSPLNQTHAFVSFCNKDEAAALEIVTEIERSGQQCWIANRDVWQNYQKEIVEAIKTSTAMVLVFSEAANDSEEIQKELSLAARYKIPRVPVRIENAEPRGAFEYELSTNQYIDIFKNREAAIQRLITLLRRV